MFLLPPKITYSQVLGIRMWTSLGGHYFAYHRDFDLEQKIAGDLEGCGLSQYWGGEDRNELPDQFGWWIRRFVLRLRRDFKMPGVSSRCVC